MNPKYWKYWTDNKETVDWQAIANDSQDKENSQEINDEGE